jgi:hypothetical protein
MNRLLPQVKPNDEQPALPRPPTANTNNADEGKPIAKIIARRSNTVSNPPTTHRLSLSCLS